MTTTTFGYGDLAPVSPTGRVVAAVLMLVGIGAIGMITASLATYFVRGPGGTAGANEEVAHVRERLGRWDELGSDERRRLAAVLTALRATDDRSAEDHRSAPAE